MIVDLNGKSKLWILTGSKTKAINRQGNYRYQQAMKLWIPAGSENMVISTEQSNDYQLGVKVYQQK